MLLNIAAFGLDQDMTQRVLTCKSAKEGSKAMLMSVVLVIPVMALFIAIGSLLYIYFQRPDLMAGMSADGSVPVFSGENVTVFMFYVLNEIPAGIKGFVTIGVIAAALSTLNSGLNSMSSVLVMDLYKPWTKKQGLAHSESHFVKAGQVSMVLVAFALASMAVLCFYWQQYSDMPLLAFALSVMVFSYSGLLGVFFTAVFSQRGNSRSVTWALISGFAVTLFFQPYVQEALMPQAYQINLGFTYQLCIGAFVGWIVCMLGSSIETNQASKLVPVS